ncbi:MAG: PEP-utilizing enzyme [Helicobacter sp.]|nr:PEP-utilizing enzyme [Helicobacter sp.]MDD7567242.1 PEP-utilizing enzyme [Helicobacter sp.]MDY5740083.1 PEP-utilizing enzyme [Helicobacter sp.]
MITGTLEFSTKAQNLVMLSNLLTKAEILPLVSIKPSGIKSEEERSALLDSLYAFGSQKIIIRSSSLSEDACNSSNAGAFESVANVCVKDTLAVWEAIQKVANSMPSSDDEVLIQPMLESIAMCGVAFSVDKDSGAPYFCISYDCSGSNDSVTSGLKANLRNFCHYRWDLNGGTDKLPSSVMPGYITQTERSLMLRVMEMMYEIEGLFGCHYLDVEFAFSKDKERYRLYCLQVRPLVLAHKIQNTPISSSLALPALPKRALERLAKRINALSAPHPYVLGNRTIFGVMPDWNPAEIIGLKPKRLALSLYKEIITDNIWAYQRDNYGYRNLYSHPLMHSFLGMGYIDVRLSFNSFIPKSLDEDIARKLVDYYVSVLADNPQLHDKIEFSVVFSCYDLNITHKLSSLLTHGFNANELKRIEFSLLDLTNSIINPLRGLYLKDLAKVDELKSRYESIVNANLPLYDRIYWCIEDCKRFGTLPFAGIARAAFVAMQMLQSLVEIGFISLEEKMEFLTSLNTVSKKLSADLDSVLQADTQESYESRKSQFLAKYGHLRAGSYNILSPRYDEAFESYFGVRYGINPKATKSVRKAFHLDKTRMHKLERILRENGLEISANELFVFFKSALEGREIVKFEFSKLLSLALKLIRELGDSLGIAVADMAHLDIKSILSLYSSLYKDSPKERFLDEIQAHKLEFAITSTLKLPALITHGDDIFSFYLSSITPNFITQKSVMAEVFVLDFAMDRDCTLYEKLRNKIVLIPSADPGFDFLFTQDIGGFITCYGGANSHMAIRAAELGLPAVIGVGEEAFARYKDSHTIRLECASEQVICL